MGEVESVELEGNEQVVVVSVKIRWVWFRVDEMRKSEHVEL